MRKPQYTERLHPRQDSHRKPYWHRTRSNPIKRGDRPKSGNRAEQQGCKTYPERLESELIKS